ncbi:MAG: M28 family peptidase [Bacteroidales bacterium]|nr:M28 family peptidase [Bacteroidales bacterium]
MAYRLAWAVFTVIISFGVLPVDLHAAKPSPVLERMRKDLFFLAGPECAGRGVSGPGIQKAADHIAAEFQAAGLKPAGKEGSYFQPFTITGSPQLGTPNTLTLTNPDGQKRELTYGQDFTPTGLTKPGKLDAELVFAGYGITAEKPAYDDYAGLKVAGKWVIVLRKSPNAGDPHGPFTQEQQSLATKAANARKHGAAGIIFVSHFSDGKDDPLMDFRYAAGVSAELPALHMKRSILAQLLAREKKILKDLETGIDEDLKPRSCPLPGWKANAVVSVVRPKIPAKNVVGVWEGGGPLAEETVVIGAHYDHLGTGEYGSLGGPSAKGVVHYGADDNASGTTGLIELARRFGASGQHTGRRIVFIAFSGEEIALLGSRHYVEHPLFPLDKTVFMLNMDMIGRVTPVESDAPAAAPGKTDSDKKDTGKADSDKKVMRDRLVIYGTGTAKGLDAFVDQAARPFDFQLLKVPGGTGPSDHDSFYRKKIPVLFFFTGTHRDYHRPSDTPDKINLPGMMKVIDLVEVAARHFAVVPQSPQYLVTQGGWSDPTDPNPRPGRMNMPKLGVMPGNYEATDGGVLVDDVTPGGAAEKGGIRKGDVIIAIAGKPVQNIGGYMNAMSTQKAGKAIPVIVLRKKDKITVQVTPTP